MAKIKRNKDFLGKLWKINNHYIFVDYIKSPAVTKGDWYKHDGYEEDGRSKFVPVPNFITRSCSKIVGKNEYNQTTIIELTQSVRKEAVETTWDEYLMAGID